MPPGEKNHQPMKHIYLSFTLCVLTLLSNAQVRSSYLYSTSMPYGTLDIRTKISSSHYYYVQEGKTFSYRESSPGVRTDTYLDMTSWDSSPYLQGNLRKKNGTADSFIMNYRMLMPQGYKSTYADGYPLILLLHGAIERANCYYNSCYHSNWSYDPNVNSPAAPKTSTHKLLNNDHNLNVGGRTHLDARNRAGTRLPNDPTVAGRMFPGFVLVPQMFNEWNVTNVQDAIRLVQLIAQKYNIDENRIYVQGLSIGGYAVYETIKRASWLFASAQPISAINDAGIFQHNQQGRVAHVPIWTFQGGNDTNPSPTYTNKLVADLRNAGAVVRYSLYSGVGHNAWHNALAEPEFYSWMLKQSKTNISVYKGITTINPSQAQYAKLMLADGFHAYQWEKDGVIISGATASTYTAKAPGNYRARFSRVAAPTSTQWNKWSPVVTITTGTTMTAMNADTAVVLDGVGNEGELELNVFPNPAPQNELVVQLSSPDRISPVQLQLIDQMGRSYYDATHQPEEFENGVNVARDRALATGLYIIIANQSGRSIRRKVIVSID
jgi:dienelactone hydrolase